MKIALISPPLLTTPPRKYGGLEMVVYDLGVALIKAGHDVTLIAPKGSRLEGGHVIETIEPPERTDVNWAQLELDAFNIYNGHFAEFDIIHDHTWFGSAYLKRGENPNLHICHTHHGHLSWSPQTRPPNTIYMNLIGISKFMCELYRKMGFQSTYAYNGIDVEKYPYSGEKGQRLIFVGRITPIKMPHVAVELAHDTGHDIDVVGGSFVDDQSYITYIKMMCSRGWGTLHLDASHETKIELMKKAKAIIVPSRMMEPYGLVAAEALACGTPVIALNDGALSEVVGTDGSAGFVCNTYDDLVEAVKKIENVKPEDCRKRGEMFSRENMAARYVKLYQRVIEGKEW